MSETNVLKKIVRMSNLDKVLALWAVYGHRDSSNSNLYARLVSFSSSYCRAVMLQRFYYNPLR